MAALIAGARHADVNVPGTSGPPPARTGGPTVTPYQSPGTSRPGRANRARPPHGGRSGLYSRIFVDDLGRGTASGPDRAPLDTPEPPPAGQPPILTSRHCVIDARQDHVAPAVVCFLVELRRVFPVLPSHVTQSFPVKNL